MSGIDFSLSARQIAEMIHSVTCQIPRMDGSVVLKWEKLSEDEKVLAEKAVIDLYSNPPRTAEENHELWMDFKLKDGWTLGDFDYNNKKHPCLIHFKDLPPSEVCKDIVWEHLINAFRSFYSENSNSN
jgi:hypothetical protein